jgi:membrane protease YdiL (CAAX protease family)
MNAPPLPPEPDAGGFPRWPLWLPLAGLAAGLTFGLLALSILASILSASGVKNSSGTPGFIAASTVIVDLSIVVATLLFAGLVTTPRPWQLGLRGAQWKLTAQIASIGALAYFLFSITYQQILQPKQPQDVLKDLGADKNTWLLVAGAVVVLLVAPVCEEIFFRGFLYRTLRLRMGLWPAAILDGLIFGVIHATSSPAAALPVLAVLGMIFCWVYERTGTLFATIALHALNNTISYGVGTENGWVAAASIGGVTIGVCVLGVLRAPRGVPAPV